MKLISPIDSKNIQKNYSSDVEKKKYLVDLIKNIYDIAGRAMAAQLVRLNTVASNLANAGSTTGDPKTTYKPLKPIFETRYLNS